MHLPLAHEPLQPLGEPARLELLGRHVDRDIAGRDARAAPAREVRARLGQDPIADRQYESALLGYRNEFRRADFGAGGPRPAHETLDARETSSADDRLIV